MTIYHHALRRTYIRLAYAAKAFFNNQLSDQVSALSFSTMFAVVPIMAVVIAIARGFGFSNFLLDQFRHFMSSQPEAAESIIKFADNYLANNHSYFIIGLGFLFMLYTVVSLFHSIERAFNVIWQAPQTRSPLRMIVDYTALTVLFTLAAIISAGLTVFVGGIADNILSALAVTPFSGWHFPVLARLIGPCLQVAALWVAFLFLYTFMPNVSVPLRCAMLPALLASVVMTAFQYIYVFIQFFLSSYNTVYGSVAVLPLFMIWLMVTWYICLFGAQLTFIHQYGGLPVSIENGVGALAAGHRVAALLLILGTVADANKQGQHPSVSDLSQKTKLAPGLVRQLLGILEEVSCLHKVDGEAEDGSKIYAAELDIDTLPVAHIVRRLRLDAGGTLKNAAVELVCNDIYGEIHDSKDKPLLLADLMKRVRNKTEKL